MLFLIFGSLGIINSLCLLSKEKLVALFKIVMSDVGTNDDEHKDNTLCVCPRVCVVV